MKKILTFGIMLLFLLMTISSANGIYVEKQSFLATLNGNTLYVGGSGPGNYTSIQEAINDSEDGDTVFVYDYSSPYNESIVIVNKSIKLISENRETTIIEGDIDVSANLVNISEFTIQGGIELYCCNNNIISDNIFISNKSWNAIELSYSCNNIITNNKLLGKHHGIEVLHSSNNNIIKGNKISNGFNTTLGIVIAFKSNKNNISGNNISNCFFGIILVNSRRNIIEKNNFIRNHRHAYIAYLWRDIWIGNSWDSNYWDKLIGNRPKIIFGAIGIYSLIRWFDFDWHPAQEPYDV